MELDDLDRDILDFERMWWTLPGRKDVAIEERFARSASDYYVHLWGLVDRPDAYEYDPLLISRLRRIRLDAGRTKISRNSTQSGMPS